ncbi:hypothetical protein FOZ62_013584, partial [Perkinsus olseni]
PTDEESVPDREGPASQLLQELRPVAFKLESEVDAERRRFGFIAQIAHAFGVENVYLLRYVTDEEFAEKCEEMLTDNKTTVADILTWCDYMESIEDTRPQLYRSANVSIKDVRDRTGSQERSVGDDVIITATAAALIAGSTPFTVTSIGKIGSEQV